LTAASGDAAEGIGGAAAADPAAVVAGRIPQACRHLLALGCGEGAVAAEFLRLNPACQVVAIERDMARARRAARVLPRVHCLDIEAGPLPRLPAAPEVVLFEPGLLAALADPAAALADFAALLAPDGMLVACVPEDEARFGFDATRAMLERAGLVPVDVEAPEGLGPRVHRMWRATRGGATRFSVMSTMLPPVGGVSQVRVVEPQRALGSLPGVASAVINRMDAVPDRQGEPGIFILHRPALLGATGLATIRRLAAQGWLVVCEFDDHPCQIPVLFRSDVQNFRAVHAIQTSTRALAEVFARENPEVAVFPNAVNRLPPVRNFAEPGRITLLFAALNREEDWPGQIEAIDAAAAVAGGRLHIHVIADRGFFDALATPHKAFTPLCDYATYLEILGGCEASFMPLRDTLFNRCKSDLKFLEASAHRAVSVASNVVYGGSIADGENGLLFDGPQALHDRLVWLVNHPDAARDMAERARAGVAGGRMLAYQIDQRLAWYRTLWARRDALHRALLARVPELG